MRRTSHCGRWRAAAFGVALALFALAPALAADRGDPPAVVDARWQPRGDGTSAQAAWRMPDGGGVTLQCDRGDARILLRVDAGVLPAGLDKLTLVADGVGMDYPLDRSGSGGYVSRIALDAPILDRILLAQAFSLQGGGRTVQTGVPGDALARVVRACRELHWPRAARIDPSDAGLAKK